MELVLVAAAIAALIWGSKKSGSASSAGPGPGGPGPGPAPGGSTPPAPLPLAPGVYPENTPGAIPIVLYVQGGDNDARLYSLPGSYAGPLPPKTTTVWYGPGTMVVFSARVDPSFVSFTAFDHFEGPGGASTRQNPFSQKITQPGYVRAVFSWLGQKG